jgi:CBS domain-containing membrane protein
MKNLKVRDLMTESVQSVQRDDTVEKVYDLMNEHGIRHLTVVDADSDLVGLVSHRDLLRHSPIERAEVPLFLMREILRRTLVEEVMTSEVETAEPDDPLSEAARRMFENKFGCLPVLEESKLVGILTESDFVRFFCDGHLQQAQQEELLAKSSGRTRAVLSWFSMLSWFS